MANPNQDRLRMHFSGLPTTAAAQATGWDTLWESSTFLPWDRGYANPALIDLLANPSSPPTSPDKNPTPGAPPPGPAPAVKLPKAVEGGRRRKALVPGCGKGYDVALFAAYGFDSVGLEVSGHAVTAAKKYLAGEEGGRGKGIEGEYEGKDGGQGKGSAVCIEGDFFDDAWLEEVGVKVEEGFDVIYDNTVSPIHTYTTRNKKTQGLTFHPVPLRPSPYPPPRLGRPHRPAPRQKRHLNLPRVPHAQARSLSRSAVVAATDGALGAAQAAGRGNRVRRGRGCGGLGAERERGCVEEGGALHAETDARGGGD